MGTANLRGYTVGSRAPPMAISSGTTIAQEGGFYKGVGTLGRGRKSGYTVPGRGGDAGLDLRNFGGEAKKSFLVHNSYMLSCSDKKNSKTGDTANLRGYTVGSRAPPMAISSGTTIAFPECAWTS